jgi:uncharacterized protein (TIGR02145 family)
MNYKIIVVAIFILSFLISCSKDNSTNPVENKYETVKICNLTWMKKNLDVDHYRNGDPIPQVTDSIQWGKLTTGAWCYYNNDPANGAIFGKLYNWYAINDSRGLAPDGWHIPSDAEWKELENCLGGSDFGGKLKETGTSHWLSPNTGATNESGFTALPGGWRIDTGAFSGNGGIGLWWSSTEVDSTKAWYRGLYYSSDIITRSSYGKGYGISIRCVKVI